MRNYLSRLSKEDQYVGDHQNGEIEIITDPQIIKRHYTIDDLGVVFEDKYILVIRDPVRFPKGKFGTYLRIIEQSGLDGPTGIVAIPIRDNLVYLRKIFRHATRRWELEFPRGFRTKGQTPSDTVRQEISEELGFNIKSLQEIGYVNANTGLLTGSTLVYLAELDSGEPHPSIEEEEAIGEMVVLTYEQLKESIHNGDIRDSFTLSALQLAQTHNFI